MWYVICLSFTLILSEVLRREDQSPSAHIPEYTEPEHPHLSPGSQLHSGERRQLQIPSPQS